MKFLIKNKKGEATDSLSFALWIFVIGIGILCLMFAFLQLPDPLRESALGDDPDTLDAINQIETYYSASFPSAGLIVYFGLILGIIVSSFFIRQHPIFIPVYILIAIATVIVTVTLGNAWSNLTEIDTFQSIIDLNIYIRIINSILSNIVTVTVVVFILSLIITFAKPGAAQFSEVNAAPF